MASSFGILQSCGRALRVKHQSSRNCWVLRCKFGWGYFWGRTLAEAFTLLMFVSKTPKYNQMSLSTLVTGNPHSSILESSSSVIGRSSKCIQEWQHRKSETAVWLRPPNQIWSVTRESQPDPCGIQVREKVLRYASYGIVTAGGPAQVGGSAPDVLSILSLMRAVYQVSP